MASKIFITISAFSRLGSVTLTNQVNILNVNSRRPEFVNAQTIFEIQKDNQFPMDLSDKYGSPIEIKVHDPDPANKDINLQCENTSDFPNACAIFLFSKIIPRSTNVLWVGTIKVNQKLNYLNKALYHFVAVAQNDAFKTKITVYQVRVLLNSAKVPALSLDSLFYYTRQTVFAKFDWRAKSKK